MKRKRDPRYVTARRGQPRMATATPQAKQAMVLAWLVRAHTVGGADRIRLEHLDPARKAVFQGLVDRGLVEWECLGDLTTWEVWATPAGVSELARLVEAGDPNA